MVSFLADVFTSFILGLLTPITAVCVLPMYPGFLAYLSNQVKEGSNKKIPIFGLLVVAGVIIFMLILGLVFTTVLQVSLTKAIGIISPIAFIILIVISILLILNVDIGKYIPKVNAPISKKPYRSSFLYGLFFGAIVIPCNPLFIAALFTKTISSMNFAGNIVSFFSFGLGIGAPLLVLAIISGTRSKQLIGFMTKHKRMINFIAGITMLTISLYYLIFVFRLFG